MMNEKVEEGEILHTALLGCVKTILEFIQSNVLLLTTRLRSNQQLKQRSLYQSE
jgi:hypothetical protein